MGISILLAESNLASAPRIADRLYAIDRGEIIFHGAPKEALTTRGGARGGGGGEGAGPGGGGGGDRAPGPPGACRRPHPGVPGPARGLARRRRGIRQVRRVARAPTWWSASTRTRPWPQTWTPAVRSPHGRSPRLAGAQEGFRFHPYPVNPLHADYLHHFDLAAQAKSRFGTPAGAGADGLKVRAAGALAERLARAHWTPAAEVWDLAEEISLDDLIAESRFASPAGWGRRGCKAGWFHAWLLLAPTLPDEAQGRAQAMLARLQQGDDGSGEERINLERISSGC